jgi:hypothetical protein
VGLASSTRLRGADTAGAVEPTPPAGFERAPEALSRIDDALFRLAEEGLERMGEARLAELAALAQTAHHARLVSLERELQGLGTVLRRYVDRDPTFRPSDVVGACNRTWLLVRGARAALAADGPMTDAVGVVRRKYEPIAGSLHVQALGAAGWVSDTGYVGITTHLLADGGSILQATVARPVTLVGPSPLRLLYQPLSEVVGLTVFDLAHGAWTLDDVRKSDDGRLSLHSQLSAAPAAAVGRARYTSLLVDHAAAIVERLGEGELDPLGGRASALVYLEPAQIRAVGINEVHARVSGEVVDRVGAVLKVVVPVRPEHDLLVENLVRLSMPGAPRVLGLFGRVWLAGGDVGFLPITATFEAPVTLKARRGVSVHELHLSIERLAEDKGR